MLQAVQCALHAPTTPRCRAAQVPNAVAEEWAAIATLAQQPRGRSTVLGRVRPREGKLDLSDASCEQGKVARTYDVQPPLSSQVPTVIISKADDDNYGTSPDLHHT